MSNEMSNGVLEWDSSIEDDGQGFVLLEEGDYEFTVSGLERARHAGSAKIPACPKAILTLSIETASGVIMDQIRLFEQKSGGKRPFRAVIRYENGSYFKFFRSK